MIKLYDFALSGNCHKVRLLLSLLAISYESLPIDLRKQEHKTEAFLKINPFGQVPALTDGKITIRDSQAILVYLARKYSNEAWLPNDAVKLAEVNSWLSVAANEVFNGPALLRVHHKFGRMIDIETSKRITANLLDILQQQLANSVWLAGDQITVADIAVYPYIALAPEGRVDLAPYPAITNWMRQIQALPGYVGMPGMLQAEQLN